MDDPDVRRTEPSGVLLELRGARLVDLDRDDLAREHRRLAPGRRAQVERPLARPRAHDVTDELRAAALRPDAALLDRRLVDAVDDPGAGKIDRVLLPSTAPRTRRTAVSAASFCARHQRPGVVGPSSRHQVSAIQSG